MSSPDAHNQEKGFVFVSIFISTVGLVDRYVLYQNVYSQKRVFCLSKSHADSPLVYRKKRTVRLALEDERIRSALELCHHSSSFRESKRGDTQE